MYLYESNTQTEVHIGSLSVSHLLSVINVDTWEFTNNFEMSTPVTAVALSEFLSIGMRLYHDQILELWPFKESFWSHFYLEYTSRAEVGFQNPK